MNLQENITLRNKLLRHRHQLALSETLMHKHPLLKDQFSAVQSLLHNLHVEIDWRLAGPAARLLMACKIALQGQETENSKTGFIGPSLQRIHEYMDRLFEASLQQTEKPTAPLLVAYNEIILLGILYSSHYLNEQGNRVFSNQETKSANEGIAFLQELGLTFVLGSKAAFSGLRSFCEQLQLTVNSQNRVIAISSCYLLLLILYAYEKENFGDSSYLNPLQDQIREHFECIEQSLHAAQVLGLFDTQTYSVAHGQLHHLRQALESKSIESIKEAAISSVHAIGISSEQLKKDIQLLNNFCREINKILNNQFNPTEFARTSHAA